MMAWCLILFIIGVFGILQNTRMMNDPDWTSRLITWGLMLAVTGILVRVRAKEKTGEKEKLRSRIEELERELARRR